MAGLTKEEELELAQLQGAHHEAPSGSGLAPDEAEELAQLQSSLKSPLDKAKDTAVTGLQAGGKVMDYTRGGLTAPILAAALGAISGKKVFNWGEWGDALDPTTTKTFPTSAELLERAGVPEGAKISDYFPSAKGHFWDAGLRGVGGAGLDAVIDPATWLTLGGSTALKAGLKEGAEVGAKTLTQRLAAAAKVPFQKAGTFYSAPADALAGMGKKVYASGLLPLEQAGSKVGKKAVAETMYKEGIWGSASSIEDQILASAKRLKGERDTILKTAGDAGARVDRGEAINEFANVLDQMVKDRRLSPQEAYKILEENVGNHLRGAAPDPMLATQWKTDLSNSLGDRVHDVTKNLSLADQLGKVAAGGYKEAVENSVRRTSGEQAAKQLIEKNSALGDLLTVRGASGRMADIAERKPVLSAVDVMLGSGAAAVTNPAKALSMLAAKKTLELSKLSGVRTGLGYAMRKAGEGPVSSQLINILSRRSAAGATRKPQGEE